MPGFLLPCHILSLLLLASCQLGGVYVSIPLQPGTAPKVPPDLVGLSLEADRLTDWTGTTSPNEFFINAMANLKGLTGVPPQIRVGGNSEDHLNYSSIVQVVQAIFPSSTALNPYPEATNVTVGDGYFAAAQFFLSNTQVTWGLNLGQNNLTATFIAAEALVSAFQSSAIKNAGVVLADIEIGNEADLYANNGARPQGYTVEQYVSEWITFATNLTSFVPASLWAGSFSGSSHSTSGFSPQGIFNGGILSSLPGSKISAVSQHHYSGTFCFGNAGVLQDLMTKAYIRGNLSQFTPDITATIEKGLDYILGETNSYSCHGAPGVSNTAGAALWMLDYVLAATQYGIGRAFFHEGIGYKYNLIQPVVLTRSITDGTSLTSPLAPHVQPQYYAAIIAAEAIGSSGNTQVLELDINDPTISGYAFYNGQLETAVLINSEPYFTTTTTARTSRLVNLIFEGSSVGSVPSTMTVKRLSVPHADDTSGVTWGGITFETPDATASGSPAITTVPITLLDGVVFIGCFYMQATEAVLVRFSK